jgi:hypothetical protein
VGNESIAPEFLTSALHAHDGLLAATASPSVTTGYEAGWVQSRSQRSGGESSFLPLPEIEPELLGRSDRCPASIPTD